MGASSVSRSSRIGARSTASSSPAARPSERSGSAGGEDRDDGGGLAAELDADACYRALATRDGRFDGRFFVCVTSTGIYCRPVCPARTPGRSRCRFVRCAAAAEEAGFRPCLRCRPETAPGTPAWAGTSASVARALRLIDEGALDRGSVAALAERLGLGDRHLRRLFRQHLGASPAAVAQTRRLHFARRLIDESDLPMTALAAAAGYRSVRRFNEAVRRGFDRSPSQLRARASCRASSEPGARFELRYREPFDWAGLIGFFSSHGLPGVELVRADRLWRTVRVGDTRGWLCVGIDRARSALVARVELDGAAALAVVAERVRSMFDLRADPAAIEQHLAGDPRLAAAVAQAPGRRVPGCWDAFELAVRAVLGQEVSVRGGITFATRLVERCGEPLALPGAAAEAGLTRLFPTPEQLRGADLSGLGLTGLRVKALHGLAEAVVAEPDLLEPGRDLEAQVSRLRALPGIGPWTASYIALRALGEPDAFPSGDLVLRQRLGSKASPVSEAVLRARAEAWRPWRGYAALLLWGESAREAAPPEPKPSSGRRRRGVPLSRDRRALRPA